MTYIIDIWWKVKGEIRNAYKVLVGKPEGDKLTGKMTGLDEMTKSKVPTSIH